MIVRLYRLARWLVPKVPPGVSYRLAEGIGDLLWLLARGVRQRFDHNQRRALGPGASDREVAASSREAIRNLVKLYLDEFRLPALSGDEIRRLVTIHGLEHLEAARARGQGVILATAHYGAPQFVSQLLVLLGYPTSVVVEHIQPEALFQLVCEMRESHGLKMVPVDKPLISLIRTLRKENGVVGLVVDRNVTESGICLPFLGEPTKVADGAVQLALRTRSPIIVAYCRRLPGNRYEAFVQPPLDLPEQPEDQAATVRAGTEALMGRLETFIREEPGQWVLSVPLWQGDCREERLAEGEEIVAG